MQDVTIVSRFFHRYRLYYAMRWPDDPLADRDAQRLAESYRLRDARDTHLLDLFRKLSGLTEVPQTYVQFLLACEFESLDIPILSFPGHGERGAAELRAAYEGDAARRAGVFPFAFDVNGYGNFCFDMRTAKGRFSVAFWRVGSDPADAYPHVTSGFDQLLNALEVTLEYESNYPDGDADRLVAALRSLDPEGIGGRAWTDVWIPELLPDELREAAKRAG